MGGELGRDADETANLIGALQLLIQMHGLSITASLFQIARQWIHGSLLTLDRGIPLALVGAERELGLPSFVISHGYLTAVKYSASLWWGPQTRDDMKRKWDVGMVTAFLFVSCIVSVLAGPASGVLMIPRVHWFFDSTLDLSYQMEGWSQYPYIMVPPQLGHGNDTTLDTMVEADPLCTHLNKDELDYWNTLSQGNGARSPTPETFTSHNFPTFSGMTYVNTTTTWGRSMDDGPGVGSSYAKAVIGNDAVLATRFLVTTPNGV